MRTNFFPVTASQLAQRQAQLCSLEVGMSPTDSKPSDRMSRREFALVLGKGGKSQSSSGPGQPTQLVMPTPEEVANFPAESDTRLAAAVQSTAVATKRASVPPSEVTREQSKHQRPRLTNSMNPQYLHRSQIPRAYELQRQQPFGKDTVEQSFTCDKSFFHIVLILYKSKLLVKDDLKSLWQAYSETRQLWREWKRVKRLPFWELRQPNPGWHNQENIDQYRVDLRMACLFHYDLDLAAVMRFLGQEHVAAHRDPDVILSRVQGLIPEKVYDEFERILRLGCPARFNGHGTRQQFLRYRNYGNHKSLSQNPEAFRKAMNKEDKRNYVLTFPSFLADFIPDLWLTPNGLLRIPGKKDRVIFDASFLLDAFCRVYNNMVTNDDEPDIIFGGAWIKFLRFVYNLRITFPNVEIYLFDDDVTAAFRQAKYNPNVISAKAFREGPHLFIPTGLTFGDLTSPPSFEPFAIARTALATELCKGEQEVPEYEEYLNAVQFAPPPEATVQFVPARADRFNPGVLDESGKQRPTEFNMHVDDNLYAAAGEEQMRWSMRCSIDALNIIMGGMDPATRPNPCDFDKFVRETVSHQRRQLGYVTDTRLLTVTIPEDKREDMLKLLQSTWGPHRRSFTLVEAAKLLGTLVSMSRVCSWGIFLFTNLHQAIYDMLERNSRQLYSTPAFRELIRQRDEASRHPTDSSQFRFFSSHVAKAIWDCKSRTWISRDIRVELDFLTTVFGNSDTYDWSSPIAHLIQLEPDYEGWQDACLSGGGGFSFDLKFWWMLEWPEQVASRTIRFLAKGDQSLVSINLLEYAAIIVGLAGSIVAWEALPPNARPPHPIALLWTDNTTAESWTRRIAGLKGPQGKALARIFAHLLMFSDVGVRAAYIEGELNVIADHLSRLRNQNDFSQFQYHSLVQQFPRLRRCRRFLPSQELLLLIYTSLLTGCANIPTTRIQLGQMEAE